MDVRRFLCLPLVVLALSVTLLTITTVEGLPSSSGGGAGTGSSSPQDSFAGLLAILNPLGGNGGSQGGPALGVSREMLGALSKPSSGRSAPLVPGPQPPPSYPFNQGQRTGQTCSPPCRFGAECCLRKPGWSQPECVPMSLTSCHWAHCIQNKTSVPPPGQAIFGDSCPCLMGSCCYNSNGNRGPFNGYCSYNG